MAYSLLLPLLGERIRVRFGGGDFVAETGAAVGDFGTG